MKFNKTIISILFLTALTVNANEKDASHSNIFTEDLSAETEQDITEGKNLRNKTAFYA